MAIWGTSVTLPAGKKVGGKTAAQIAADIRSALAAKDSSKLKSLLSSLHDAGYSGSYNASQPFLDVLGRSDETGIVPDSVANQGQDAVDTYVEDNDMGPSATQGSGQGDAWTDSAANMEKVNVDIKYDDKPEYAGEDFINKSKTNWKYIGRK